MHIPIYILIPGAICAVVGAFFIIAMVLFAITDARSSYKFKKAKKARQSFIANGRNSDPIIGKWIEDEDDGDWELHVSQSQLRELYNFACDKHSRTHQITTAIRILSEDINSTHYTEINDIEPAIKQCKGKVMDFASDQAPDAIKYRQLQYVFEAHLHECLWID